MAGQKASGPPKKLIAFKMAARSAPPRPDYPIFSAETNSRQLGTISSGTQSPSLNLGIGLGFVPPEFSKPGTRIDIEVRGKKIREKSFQNLFIKNPNWLCHRKFLQT